MNLHAELQRDFPSAIRGSCNKEGCRLKFDRSLSSYRRTIIDADDYAAICHYKGKICDYFLFLTIPELIVAVVEMKSGRIQASDTEAKHIAEQLGNGARESEKLVQSRPDSTFRPILLYGSMKSRMRVLLAKYEVTFKGKKHKILTAKCGSKLRDLL
jgi:hypothetical protein